MAIKRIALLLHTLLIPLALTAQQETLSPLDFGLDTATSGTSRYHILLKTHDAAVKRNAHISYRGIDTIDLTIPKRATSIPLPRYTDFSGVVILVRNDANGMYLFRHSPRFDTMDLHLPDSTIGHIIDNGDFNAIPQLSLGEYLVAICDSTPWVSQRADHAYPHYREDLLRVKNGFSADRPIMPYGNTHSHPRIAIRPIDKEPLILKDLTFIRDSQSLARTYLCRIDGEKGVLIQNIAIHTPQNEFVGDCAISLYHCSDVTLDSITILGTYSRTDHSGYGILLNNLRSTTIQNLYSRTAWGVFGTNNMADTRINQSDFNRFDIHCYGRNVTFVDCKQSNGFNQFSATYGTILFKHCNFDNFTPLLIEESYNCNVPFLTIVDSCSWTPTPNKCHFMAAGHHSSTLNARPELANRYIPDIQIRSLDINAAKEIREILLFRYSGKVKTSIPLHGRPALHLEGIHPSHDLRLKISNHAIKLSDAAQVLLPHNKAEQIKRLKGTYSIARH